MLGCKWLDSCENNAFIEFIYLLSRFAGEIVCHAQGTLTAVASFCSFVQKLILNSFVELFAQLTEFYSLFAINFTIHHKARPSP